jgi:hypothetical protein
MDENKKEYYLSEFEKIHNNKWEYLEFLTESIKGRNRYFVLVKCKSHGIFKQRIDSHLKGAICKKCNTEKRNLYELGYDEFLKRSIEIHGNKYKYPEQKIKNFKSKVSIICSKHGEFKQIVHNHIINKNGCSKCGNEVRGNILTKDEVDVINTLKEVYKNNDRIIFDNIIYVNNYTPLEIVCKIHGKFKILFDSAKKGQGCKYCNKDKSILDAKLNFLEQAKNVWGDIFDYSNIEFLTMNKSINIEYKGKIYKQLPNNHLKGHSPIKNKSNGEIKIENILIQKGIIYEKQKTFEGLTNKIKLRFDFYIPDKNLCIEYNGIQHYKPIDYLGGDVRFINQQENDNIKREFCRNNNISLLEISYLEFKKIDNLLEFI